MSARKQRPDNVFTSALPVEMEFSDAPASGTVKDDESVSFASKILDMIVRLSGKPNHPTSHPPAVTTPAVSQLQPGTLGSYNDPQISELTSAVSEFIKFYAQDQIERNKKFSVLQEQIAELIKFKTQVENHDANPHHRPLAMGGNSAVRTDC